VLYLLTVFINLNGVTRFITYHRVCNLIKKTSATSGAGTSYPSGAHEFTLIFSGIRVSRSLVFSVMFSRSLCRSLFVLVFFFFWSLCCLSFDLRILITLFLTEFGSISIRFGQISMYANNCNYYTL
jgi:hypothetical protein